MRPGTGHPPRGQYETADRTRLDAFRLSMLTLHRSLLDATRIEYERTHGQVGGHMELFRLVKEEAAFAWLRSVSDLIVQLDETIDQPVPGMAEQVVSAANALLLLPEPADPNFRLQYHEALQREVDVVIAHSSMAQALRPLLGERFVILPPPATDPSLGA
ncbi:MAG: hypothetical protein IT349_01590 [Candidatus Eisenbacteria bacterium]|nr:hypothetical protein [Candidatus Eisenbacteria bacterium]MCC7140769.1 hypothetical protein [Candidatus Eisenbacteria bacterium]